MTAHNEKIETVAYKGKTYTGNHTQLCNRFKINRLTFASRLKVGWSIVEALGIKKRPVKRESGRMAKKLRKYFLYKHKPTRLDYEGYTSNIDGWFMRYPRALRSVRTNPIHI